ncbi:GNAT family N-acetyltransferase [Arthrobacter crystallopoietes]|uniref:Ribosomal protein S18 acetylase RimI n=1 Tax=Crystallibacter crystallopoietes TaxID=37928 RepID=A0A1H0Z9G0_9MICC|nr:GNAT family N-acetyltransferase [Arthrobacter crystallopoietes]AUI52090.1 GNAT family N-acetyltransferase [Arthrobacter crystallopoietes]SDQ24089.1 Ribosomal protein S18 acetylase RimI [Arthrobacter crystallopoietes]
MSITIRPATAADYDDVARITREAYVHGGHIAEGDGYLDMLGDVAHRARHAVVWVAELDGKVAGSVALTFEGQEYSDIARAGELEFRMLAVDPAIQRAGIGRAMVEAIVEYARTVEGIHAVSLTSIENMTNAHRLYESLGFERIRERDWKHEDTGLFVFVKTLES